MVTDNSQKIMNLAIDVNGADGGETIIIRGCDLISKQIKANFIFVGKKSKIQSIINNSEHLVGSKIIDTPFYIKAHEKGSEALRTGKKSSMRIAIDLVKEGKANAIISAGNTGALLSISYIVLISSTIFSISSFVVNVHNNCDFIINLSTLAFLFLCFQMSR